MEREKRPMGSFCRAAALMLAWSLPACYSFHSVDLLDATPGEEVQLVLSGAATRGLAPSALTGETLVQGDLVGVSEDSVSVSVWIGQAYRGTPFEQTHQAYAFPRVELVRLERRQLSKPRTALAALGVLAGIYLLIDGLEFLEDPNPGPPGEGNEPPSNPFTIRFSRIGQILSGGSPPG